MKGIAMLDIAPGRRELGWEVGFVAVTGTTTPNPVAAVVLNNDADFVCTRIWVCQFGPSAGNMPLPNSVLLNVRDGATGNVLLRQSGVPASFFSVPFPGTGLNANANPSGRFASANMGLPSPYLVRRGNSVFFEFVNSAAITFAGDLYVVMEGFRVYPGQEDPVPKQVKGYTLPYSWNGVLQVATGLSGGLQQLGTVTMPGPGQGKYLLKFGSITTTLPLGALSGGIVPSADVCLAVQVRDTKAEGKFWARMTNPPSTLGQYMPAFALTGGGIGAPWCQPRYITGQDTIFVDVYADPAAWSGNIGNVEIQFNGVLIP